MIIQDSQEVSGRKKVVIAQSEIPGLDEDDVADFADANEASFTEGQTTIYILQFSGEPETRWRADELGDALYSHCGV